MADFDAAVSVTAVTSARALVWRGIAVYDTVVADEDRAVVVAAEERTSVAAFENRVISVPVEDRLAVVPSDTI